MNDLKLKGRITEILEGGKVLRQDLFRELKTHPQFEGLSCWEFNRLLNEMLSDETVRKVLVENRKKGRIEECWELNE